MDLVHSCLWDAWATHANLHSTQPSGQDGCRTYCFRVRLCVWGGGGGSSIYRIFTTAHTHLHCPSQSPCYPASQPWQERITACSCHVTIPHLTPRRMAARASLCQTVTSLLPTCLFFNSVLSALSWPGHSLFSLCCIMAVLSTHQLLGSTSVTTYCTCHCLRLFPLE